MSKTLHERARELFELAVDLPASDRAAFVEDACLEDNDLRRQLERLFAADEISERLEKIFSGPITRPKLPTKSEPLPVANGFRIIRPIAQGGMGVVYEAQQQNPPRTVALKVNRPGRESFSNMKRFEKEASFLAKLQHTSICQVYEVGVLDDGRQFIAMEYVPGESIDKYSQRSKLGKVAILDLFARVCDAIQYAHANGIIHRDLKPENILVNASGQPKVLDFGLARETSFNQQSWHSRTATGLLFGTPNYMSPEHITHGGKGIDQRSDVYALGVILFELLAERLPYSLENLPVLKAIETITEVEPPKLGGLKTSLRGDLETIVAKALAKDPELRYQSAEALAQDIRRHLARMPIRAHRPSILYRARKYVQRNRIFVGGMTTTLIALILGLISTMHYAMNESYQRIKAIAQMEEAEFQAYRARMAAAVGAQLLGDVVDTRPQIEAAPKKHRGWEWQYFHSQIDGASDTCFLDTPGSPNGTLLLTGTKNELIVGLPTDNGLRFSHLQSNHHHTVPLDGRASIHVNACQTILGIRVARWIDKNAIELIDQSGRRLSQVDIPEAYSPQPIVLSLDGSLVATHWEVGNLRRIGIFEADSGKRIAVCDGHNDGVWNLVFSPDAKRIVSCGEDAVAKIWDTTSGELISTCSGHRNKVLYASFRADGARLVTTSSDGTVRQWNTLNGKEIEPPYSQHRGEIATAVYSPDGRWIASGGWDNTIRLWDSNSGKLISVLQHPAIVRSLAFASDSKWLVSGSVTDPQLRVWDPTNACLIRGITRPTGRLHHLTLSPDNKHAGVTVERDWKHHFEVLEMETGKSLFAGEGMLMAYSSDGKWIATLAPDRRTIHLLDSTTHQWTKSFVGHEKDVLGSVFCPQSRRLASFGADQKVRLWNVFDGTHETLIGHSDDVFSAAFTSDSSRLATAGRDRAIWIWDLAKGQDTAKLLGHTYYISSLVFNSNGEKLISGSGDLTVRIWSSRPISVLRSPSTSLSSFLAKPKEENP